MISPKFGGFYLKEAGNSGIALSINNGTITANGKRRVLLLMGDGHAGTIGESSHSIVNAILAYLGTEKLVLQIIVFQLLLHLNLIKLVLLGTSLAINQSTSGTSDTLTSIIKPRGIFIVGASIAHRKRLTGPNVHAKNSKRVKASIFSTLDQPRWLIKCQTPSLFIVNVCIVLGGMSRTLIAKKTRSNTASGTQAATNY